MRRIISLLVVLVLTLGIAPFSTKAAYTNYSNGYEQFEITANNTTRYFDFDIRKVDNQIGVPIARLELKGSYMTKGKTYRVFDKKTLSQITSFVFNGQDYIEFAVKYGQSYILGISDINSEKPDQIEAFFDSISTPSTLSVKTIKEVTDSFCDKISGLSVYSTLMDRFTVKYYCDSRHAVYVDGKYQGDHKGKYGNEISYYVDSADGKTKFKPGTKHSIKLLPYITLGGANFLGTAVSRTATVAPFTAPAKPKVTKLNSKMISVVFNSPAFQQKAGLSTFYIYAGKKKVKTVKNTGKSKYKVTVKKKGIAKKKIKIVALCTATKKKLSSKAVKAGKNYCKWNYVKSLRAYTGVQGYLRPAKLYYSGKKLILKGFYVNTHIFKLKKFKVKLRIYVNGKVVVKKIITVKNMKDNSIKNFKKTLKKGKYYDLKNNYVSWGYDVLADQI